MAESSSEDENDQIAQAKVGPLQKDEEVKSKDAPKPQTPKNDKGAKNLGFMAELSDMTQTEQAYEE
jgi:hypothetical protein